MLPAHVIIDLLCKICIVHLFMSKLLRLFNSYSTIYEVFVFFQDMGGDIMTQSQQKLDVHALARLQEESEFK